MSSDKQPSLNPMFEPSPGSPDRPASPEDSPPSEDARQPMLPKPASGTANGGVKVLHPGRVGIFHPTRALYRWIIMVSISMLSVSGYYLYDNIGSMEQTIEEVQCLLAFSALTLLSRRSILLLGSLVCSTRSIRCPTPSCR